MNRIHLLGTVLAVASSSPSWGDDTCIHERLVIRGTIQGRVLLRVDERAEPLPDATVELREDQYGRRLLKTVTSGPDGTFSFTGTRPGSYSLRVQRPGVIGLSVDLSVEKANQGGRRPKRLRIVLGNDAAQHCSGSTAEVVEPSERD